MTLDKLGAASQAEIGRRYALDKTTISRNLKPLERKGWIAARSSNGARERRFALTAEGHRRLAAAKPEWKRAQEQLRAGMTGRQWDAMFDTFRTVARAARAAQSGGAAKAGR